MNIRLADLNILEMEKCFDLFLLRITHDCKCYSIGGSIDWRSTPESTLFWHKLYQKTTSKYLVKNIIKITI